DCLVQRHDQPHIMSEGNQCPGQRSRHVAETAGTGKGRDLGGHKQCAQTLFHDSSLSLAYHHQLFCFFAAGPGAVGCCPRGPPRWSVQKRSAPKTPPPAKATNTATDAGADTSHQNRRTPTGVVFCAANTTSSRAASKTTIIRIDMPRPL